MNDSELESLKIFLDGVKSLESFDEKVLINGSIAIDEEIMGLLAFEDFNHLALLRYFIFKSKINQEDILHLIEDVKRNIVENKFEQIVAIINDDNVYNLLKELGFKELANEKVILTEKNLIHTSMKNSKVLEYKISN